MKEADEFLNLLINDDPAGVTPEMVDSIAREYPFFTLPALMLLKRDNKHPFLSDELRDRYMAMLVLNAGDPETMMALVDHDSDKWLNFYPAERVDAPTTEDAIDVFLNNYGSGSERENDILEKLIFNPTPDYAEMLAKEAVDEHAATASPAAEGDETLNRINAFIASRRGDEAIDRLPEEVPIEPPSPAVEPAPEKPLEAPAPKPEPHHPVPDFNSRSSLSESLAKIYIKQKKYEKAREIIHNLSVNHPGKSNFYNDQLRFLDKLILNQKAATVKK